MTGASRWQQIAASLASKEARQEFVAATIRNRLPAQIREIRRQRKWTQKHLAELAGMRQPAIWRCESMGYDQFTLSTLKAIAAAFDVGLKVEFVPFSELVHNAANPEIYGLNVPSHDLDMGFETYGETNTRVEPGIDLVMSGSESFGAIDVTAAPGVAPVGRAGHA